MSKIINIYYRRWPFSTLTVTSKLPLFKANLAKVTRSCCLQAWLFLKVWVIESSFHFCDGSDRFFPRVRVIMNLRRFDALFDKKRSIMRLYLFFICLFSVEEQRWLTRVAVLLDPYIFLGKKSAEKWSKGNGETFRIFSFLGFGFGGHSDRRWNWRREYKVLFEEEETV